MWVSEIIGIECRNKRLFDKCCMSIDFIYPAWTDKLKSFVN